MSEDDVKIELQEQKEPVLNEGNESSPSLPDAKSSDQLLPPEATLKKRYTVTKIQVNLDTQATDEVVIDKMTRMSAPKIPLFLQWKDICYNIPVVKKEDGKKIITQRPILKKLYGKVAPGELLAIMGPTGSGKTTLLSVLSRRLKKGVTGEILVNATKPDRNYKRRSAYVLQDDVLFANLTVEETLKFTAKLRLPNQLSQAEKMQKVEEVIDVLNLGKARKTLIGGPFQRGVSGGERKRVNIGNELLTNPSLLLLDEPTSGLDTSTAVNLMLILKGLSQSGITVVSSIHQPSSQMFELFDKLLLLVDGQTIYFGKANEAVSYFSKLGLECSRYYNPGDFMMGLLLKEEIRKENSIKNQLIEAYVERDEGSSDFVPDTLKMVEEAQKKTLAKQPRYPVSFLEQFSILLHRTAIQSKGNVFDKIPFIQITLISILVGLFWWQLPREASRIQDRFGALFFILIFPGGFFPLFNSVYNFPPERGVVQRERASGSYYLSAYYSAKILADIPLEQVFPFIFISISYFMIGLRLDPGAFFTCIATVGVMNFCSSGIGLSISAAVMNLKVAAVTGGIFMLVTMLIGGFYLRLSLLPSWITWLQYLSIAKYGYEAILINEFSGLEISSSPGFESIYPGNPIKGEAILQNRGVSISTVGGNLGVLLLFGIFFRIIAFLFLKNQYRQKT